MSVPVIPNAVALLWDSFVETVLSREAPPDQVKEMKLAFYGGAHGLLCLIQDIMDPDEEPTDRDMLQMQAINAELELFAFEVGAAMPMAGNA